MSTQTGTYLGTYGAKHLVRVGKKTVQTDRVWQIRTSVVGAR